MKVGFFPGDNAKTRWSGEIHPWSALATQALREKGCETQFINRDELCALPVRTEFDVIHLNWPQSLANPNSYKRRKYLPHAWYERWFRGELDRLASNLLRTETPIVWQVHDLPYSGDPRTQGLMESIFEKFHEAAGGMIFYEQSAQAPFFELFRPPEGRVLGVAHLGEYESMHGPPIAADTARSNLGIAGKRRVFLYPGTIRYTRNPSRFIQTFLRCSTPDDLLIVTGRGTHKIVLEKADDRVLLKPGMVEHTEFRDLLCAADFVVNDAFHYLGSAIIRVALEYGTPVIASSFGCTSDIAKGAYIPIADGDDGLEQALETALQLPRADYLRMVESARERHLERPWSAYGAGCVDVYKRTIAATK